MESDKHGFSSIYIGIISFVLAFLAPILIIEKPIENSNISITILNPEAYLKDNNIWTIEFDTKGKANLTISPTNANWQEFLSDNPKTEDEMRFLDIKCGNISYADKMLVIDENKNIYNYITLREQDSIRAKSILIPDYSCNQTSYLTNYMSKAGYATLQFTFGGYVAYAYDPDTGNLSAGVGGNAPGDVEDWNSPENITSSNDRYATVTLLTTGDTAFINATNFSFSIPADATINGIQVTAEAYESLGLSAVDSLIARLSWDGGASFTPGQTLTVNLATTEANYSFGNRTELWGRNWTASEFTNANFKAQVRARIGGNADATFNLDHVAVAVFYTEASTSSCTYSSGNWNVLASDNCNITSAIDVGSNNITINGTGTFTTNVSIINWTRITITGTDANNIVTVTCRAGCFNKR